MSEYTELIAELRRAGAGGVVDRLTNRAADALEALTTPPTDDEREALIATMREARNPDGKVVLRYEDAADAILAAGFRRPAPVTEAQVRRASRILSIMWAADPTRGWSEMARAALEAARNTTTNQEFGAQGRAHE